MRIIQVAAEFAPIAKAGGLGEVVLGLSRELTRVGETVDVIIPKYSFISKKLLQNLKVEIPEFYAPEAGESIPNTMWETSSEGCHLHLLETHHKANYFGRNTIYGFDDDIPRFLYFSRAVVEYLKIQKKPIDILHLHDWHVSAIAPLIRSCLKHNLNVKAIALSIHNVEYQGKCAAHDVAAIGIKDTAPLKSDDEKYPHTVNLLKGGIVYSDAVVPVSPSYAQEILTEEYGFGLCPTLQKYKSKISGILNGIDLTLWNPATDGALGCTYSATNSIAKIAAAKKSIQHSLQTRFHLQGGPWIGTITRLVPQKAPELIEEALKETIRQEGTFFLLASSPIPEIQSHFEALKIQYKDNPHVHLELKYDETLAHQLYAALDFLIVPSHFEPCGLTQLIAMHYGTLPIVRSTGGLKDTVFDCEDPFVPQNKRNGFVFQQATKEDVIQAVTRAIDLWKTNPAMLKNMMRLCMKSSVGWEKPAQDYLRLYAKMQN